jgi:hypothetical protein
VFLAAPGGAQAEGKLGSCADVDFHRGFGPFPVTRAAGFQNGVVLVAGDLKVILRGDILAHVGANRVTQDGDHAEEPGPRRRFINRGVESIVGVHPFAWCGNRVQASQQEFESLDPGVVEKGSGASCCQPLQDLPDIVNLLQPCQGKLGDGGPPYGIRVNAVGPGQVVTEMTRPRWDNPAFLEFTNKRTPLGRMGQPEEVVGAVVYFLSEDASWTTGTTLYVDGGWTAQ